MLATRIFLTIVNSIDVILSTLGPVLQIGLAAIMLFRRLYRPFPVFAAYTLYALAVFVVRHLSRNNTDLYYILYSLTEVVYGLLGVLAMREAFEDALIALHENHPWTRVVPILLLVLLLGGPVVWALYRPYGQSTTFYPIFASGVYSFRLVVRCIQVLVFSLYLFLKKRYEFRRYHAGILTGFGVFALMTLAAFVLQSTFGKQFEAVYRYMVPGAYLGAAIIWLIAFLSPERPPDRNPPNREKVRNARIALEGHLQTAHRIRRKNRRNHSLALTYRTLCYTLFRVHG
jgi:hypothetical protein